MSAYNPLAWERVPGFANSFDRYGWVDYRQNVIDWVRSLKPAPARLLDVGCCRGEYLRKLKEEGFAGELLGVDVTPQCVEAARSAGLDVRQADCRMLPFASREFDVVLFLNVLMHLPDPAQALAEVCRVAGKHLVLSCYGATEERGVWSRNTKAFLNTFYPKSAVLSAMPEGWRLAKFETFVNPFGDPVYQYLFTRRKAGKGE